MAQAWSLRAAHICAQVIVDLNNDILATSQQIEELQGKADTLRAAQRHYTASAETYKTLDGDRRAFARVISAHQAHLAFAVKIRDDLLRLVE